MAGQMGNEPTTVLNLSVIEILAEDNAVVVSGSIPGPDGGLVVVRHAAKERRYASEERAHG